MAHLLNQHTALQELPDLGTPAVLKAELPQHSGIQASLHRQSQALEGQAMSQAFMQRPYKSRQTLWPSSNAHQLLWLDTSAVDGAFAMDNKLHAEPVAIADMGFPSGARNDLEYGNSFAGPSSMTKAGNDHIGGSSWAIRLSESAEQHATYNFGGSDLSTAATSTSPKSYFSNPSEHNMAHSPKTILDQTSAHGAWANYGSASSDDVKPCPSPQDHVAELGINPGFARLGGHNSSSLHSVDINIVPPVGQHQEESFGNHAGQLGRMWTHPFTQNGTMTWQAPSEPNLQQPYYQQDFLQPAPSHVEDIPSLQQPQRSPYYAYRTRGETQQAADETSFGTASSAETDTQRKMEDDMLLEGKAAGLTYKEIRKQMGATVAESTLRGRYRALTKEKRDRVRKPVWHPQDIRLLEEIVSQELGRLGDGYRRLDKAQRLSKVSWKKVAEHIADNGGSYHFGNSTCKKKWAELEDSR